MFFVIVYGHLRKFLLITLVIVRITLNVIECQMPLNVR
jgi:hypothetical protein